MLPDVDVVDVVDDDDACGLIDDEDDGCGFDNRRCVPKWWWWFGKAWLTEV